MKDCLPIEDGDWTRTGGETYMDTEVISSHGGGSGLPELNPHNGNIF